MFKPVAIATAIAGTLDILAAFVIAAPGGTSPVRVLQSVASGPLGDIALASAAYAFAGLLVHFLIMACMVAVYFLVAARLRPLRARPLLGGLAYGLLLWFVMYGIVIPLRWASVGVPHDPVAIAVQLFCHIFLVGIPIALVIARFPSHK